jgi:iron complex outermembrane recepter protein
MLLHLRWEIAARSTRSIALFTTVCAWAFVGPVRAQDTTTQLPPVVVEDSGNDTKAPRKRGGQGTDTRLTDVEGTTTQGAKGSGKSTTSGDVSGPVGGGGGITGASTSIISREDIERAPEATLADIISRAAGAQTSSLYGNVNGVGTTVDLRGFGITGASNTLILINGRRQNDWDLPGFDLSTIAKESVDRIEITRGNSGAVLYGDGAVGGVINIVTRNGVGVPNQARIEGGIGSFATRVENISASGSSGPFSAFVIGNNFNTDGYRDNNEFEERSAVGDFRWTFAKGSVYFNIAGDGQRLGLPGARTVDLGAGINQVRDDRRGTSTPFDNADQQGVRGTLGFTYMLAPKVELIVDGGVRSKDQQAAFFSPFSEQYVDTNLTTKSLTPRINITQPLFGLPSRLITGIDVFDTDYDSHRSMFEGLAPVHIYDGGQEMLAGYFLQTLSILPTTDLSAGGRIQRNRTTASDTFDASAPGAFGVGGLPLDQSETNHAWHLGAEQKLFPSVALFGRLAQSFRIANIDERIGSAPFGVPTNFDLRTQKSHDWETGVRLNAGPFEIRSSYYEMRLTDEIHFDPVTFVNTNLDPTRRRGVETIASWQIMKEVRLRGNLTYTNAEFWAGPFGGNEVPMVSPWTGNVGLSWEIVKKGLTLDTDLHYVGDRRMDNDNANVQPLIPAYTTVDLRLGGQIEQFFWSAAVLNLFDVDYFDYAVASAFTLNRYNAYPLPGRTYMLKAGTTW